MMMMMMMMMMIIIIIIIIKKLSIYLAAPGTLSGKRQPPIRAVWEIL
jgi:hypothetical protein